MNTARNRILALFTVLSRDIDLALPFGQLAVADDAIDFTHDSRLTWATCFEEFDDAR